MAKRDHEMRTLINDEGDEQDDEDDDDDTGDDDDVNAADDGDAADDGGDGDEEEDEDEDEDEGEDQDQDQDQDQDEDADEDEDEEGEDEDEDEDENENEDEDDDPLPAVNLLSGGAREGPRGDRTWVCQKGGGWRGAEAGGIELESFRVSDGPGAGLFLVKARQLVFVISCAAVVFTARAK